MMKKAGDDPEIFEKEMRNLGRYHAKDIHNWKDEEGEDACCSFHDSIICSCSNCETEVSRKKYERGEG